MELASLQFVYLFHCSPIVLLGETPPEGATDADPTSRPPLLVNPEVVTPC